ncbi:uncharacterized protein [Haliotis asinina]|uniref:uncharacterized protein n=1 Tax=Haliotis asinina TaxID=109174 RepID=UPI003531B1BA
MNEHSELLRRTSDTDESDDSSVPSRYSSEGEIPLPTFDDLSEIDDPEPGFRTSVSGDMLQSSVLSLTEKRKILRILPAESKQSFFGIFPTNIEAILNTKYAQIVQRLKDLPDRDCTVIIAGGSLLKMIDPSWEGKVPASVLCDVCVFSPTQPVMLLTFTGKDGNMKTITKYNTSLAMLIINHVKKDTNLDFKVVHLAVDYHVSQEKTNFLTRVDRRVNSTKCTSFPTELDMDKGKCTAIMKSFLKHLSWNTESERLYPSLQDTAHATVTPRQDAADELQKQIHTMEVNPHHEVQTALLRYLSVQQEKLENESSPHFWNTTQENPFKVKHLEGDARTSNTRHVFPTCSVCQQQFSLKGPAPYLLPCLHAVCETCVTSRTDGVMSCSTCQRQVDLEGTSLQKDAVRQKEIFYLTAKHRPTELLCTHEDDGNQAVCWCQECEELLCEYCQTMHSSLKVFRDHLLQNISDLVPTVSNIPTFCSTHKYDSLYLFDKSCQKLICARCRLGDHAEHDVEELDMVGEAVTKQLHLHKDVLSTLQDRRELNIKSVMNGRKSTQRMHSIWKETVDHTFQTLRSQLDQSEKEFLFDLERQSEEANATQHALLTTYENDWKICTGVLDYINKVLLYGSKLDILAVESSIRDMTQTCQDTATPEIRDNYLALCNNSMSKLKSITSGFASLLTSQSVKDADAQTDDVYMADVEMNHNIRLEEKEVIKERAARTIDFLLREAKECVVHKLKSGTVDRSMLLKCTLLKYDKDRANLDYVHINTEGELVNRKSDTRPAGEGRLKKYKGTCSTVPLLQDGCAQYWEVETRVSLDRLLPDKGLILEVGLCREEKRDVHHCIGGRPHSYSMTVAHCTKHGGICRRICNEGKCVQHLPDTLPNTAGVPHTQLYGVVCDDARKTIVFIDVKEKKVMSSLDNINTSEPLWPMFGVYSPSVLTVNMRLLADSDVNMTEEKKAMIVKALS